MYHVIVSFDFLQYYFFAEIAKTIHLEQVMYGILKSDQFMLPIINYIDYIHTYHSPAVPTDSQKITCLKLKKNPTSYTNSPTFLKHLIHLSPRNLVQHEVKHLL